MDEKPRATPYPLRMPGELRAKLEAAAAAASRSLHAEIVARLEASFASMQTSFFDDNSVDLAARVEAGHIWLPATALLDKLIMSKLGAPDKLASMLTLAGELARTAAITSEKNKPLLSLPEELQRAQQLVEKLKAMQESHASKDE